MRVQHVRVQRLVDVQVEAHTGARAGVGEGLDRACRVVVERGRSADQVRPREQGRAQQGPGG
ncbi:hypothetical protein [Sphaerisporangium perillae]|uniref:hypothetical protein n=1 Tax=Sphaerisporangium perillae TaxID=2935860 RepID=UPI0035586FDB